MKTRPTVFLSHSKKDKEFIVRIANDLKSCRIDGWYDEWEIPAGTSFRRKIFDEGIPNCDCFFVYLTDASIHSYWVQKELDAAFIQESRNKNVSVITFIEKDDLRAQLSSDLASLHSPILNVENYDLGFRQLLANIFEAKIKRVAHDRSLQEENSRLIREKEIESLKSQILAFRLSGGQSLDALRLRLAETTYNLLGHPLSLLEIFRMVVPDLSFWVSEWELKMKIHEHLGVGLYEHEKGIDMAELLRQFIWNNLVDQKIDDSKTDRLRTSRERILYCISESGKGFVLFLDGSPSHQEFP